MIYDPLVSVVIASYNRASLIKRALISALSQTYNNLEIIVVDDGSTDNTSQVTCSFGDERIKLFRHEKNKGLAASRNTGIKNSSGGFITFLDDDDEWLPEKIQRQLDIFKEPDIVVGLVFTNGYSEAEGRMFIAKQGDSGIIYDPVKNKFFPLRILITPPSSWMLPMKIIKEIGYFDETMYNNWDDGDYFVRVASKYPIYFLNKNLVAWHVLENHVNRVNSNLIKGKEIFLKNNSEFLKKDKGYLFRFYRTLGKDALKIDKQKARHYLFKALKLNPFDFSTLGKIIKTF